MQSKSPFANRAVNPWRFSFPRPEYDLAITLKQEGALSGFETKPEARAEDQFRASSLLKLGGDHTELGQWLGKATTDKLLALSCASSFYMRETRRRLLGAVHEQFHD